ncbi:hypothetical protein [Aquimixticola soesokkakensis]|nr:hypothetical protein [Aquimixticola soesokkakensis]
MTPPTPLYAQSTSRKPDQNQTRILVVGEVARWRLKGGAIIDEPDLHYADFYELTFDLMATLRPDVVLSPVICAAFDCLDLAQRLSQLEFRGLYRSVAVGLPRPEIIKREVRGLCPDIDFDFLADDALSPTLN